MLRVSPVAVLLVLVLQFTTPVLSVLNPYRRFAHWVLAPMAKTQREMDLYFQVLPQAKVDVA